MGGKHKDDAAVVQERIAVISGRIDRTRDRIAAMEPKVAEMKAKLDADVKLRDALKAALEG